MIARVRWRVVGHKLWSCVLFPAYAALMSFVLFTPLPVHSQASSAVREIEPVHRGAPANARVALRLWIPDGTVQVRYWSRDSVDIRATLGRGARLVGNVAESGGKYAVEFDTPTAPGFARAEVVLTVPEAATLWIKSTLASVEVRGGSGQLDVLTVSGNTHVSAATGIVTVESIEGDVLLERLTGLLRVRGGGGQLTLQDVSGRTSASLVNGAIHINPLANAGSVVPSGRLETVSGGIRVRGALVRDGDLQLTTHDGAIALQFPTRHVPRVRTSAARQASLDAALRTVGGNGATGALTIDTFKGTLNISTLRGIP